MTIVHRWIERWCAFDRPLRALPRAAAAALLLALAAALAWSSMAVPAMSTGDAKAQQTKAEHNGKKGIGDFALYELIYERVAAGEDYYAVAIEEQRANRYPVKPFITVRLPTLVHVQELLSLPVLGYVLVGMLVLAIALFLPMTQDRSLLGERVVGALALLFGASSIFARQAPLSHELVAGCLLTLALFAYRPHRYWPSLILAAMALAFRELALPFVLLWLVLALAGKRWREASWVGAVIALFALGLLLHAENVAALVTPDDRTSPGWDAMAGPALPMLGLSRMTGLIFLPKWLAGPLAILPLLGWLAIGGKRATFAAVWFGGFFLAMSLFARVENYYWVLIVIPAYAAGLAFAPRAVLDLFAAAMGKAGKAGKTGKAGRVLEGQT